MAPNAQFPNAPAQNWLDLAALLDPEAVVATPPERSAVAWTELYHFAAAHLVGPSLYATLVARGRLNWLPEPMGEALAALYQLNDAHNHRLRQILVETTQLLNSAGIRPMVLKGAIALLPDQYPTAFARMMSDLDLAMTPDAMPTAVAVLLEAGYYLPRNIEPAVLTPGTNAHDFYFRVHHHAPPLMHPSGGGYVELHRAILGRGIPPAALSLATVEGAAMDLDWEGVSLRVPALVHRLIHNSLHHQVSDDAFNSNRRSFRQLLEFAQLRALPAAAEVDWSHLLGALDVHGMGDALRVDLLATQQLFSQPLPSGVRPSPTSLAVEGRFWLRNKVDPRIERWMERERRLQFLTGRLRKLPQRLITLSWYSGKLAYLWRNWSRRRARKRATSRGQGR